MALRLSEWLGLSFATVLRRELLVLWQSIIEAHPRKMLRVPVVKRRLQRVRIVQATNSDVNHSWNVVGMEADLSSALPAKASTRNS